MTLRHDCKRDGCYKDAHLPDWGFLDDCFPHRVSVSDIDGVVELDGQVMFLEWKQHTSKVTAGQVRMYRTLTKLFSGICVLIIFGPLDEPESIQLYRDGKVILKKEADKKYIKHLMSRWAISTGRMK